MSQVVEFLEDRQYTYTGIVKYLASSTYVDWIRLVVYFYLVRKRRCMVVGVLSILKYTFGFYYVIVTVFTSDFHRWYVLFPQTGKTILHEATYNP